MHFKLRPHELEEGESDKDIPNIGTPVDENTNLGLTVTWKSGVAEWFKENMTDEVMVSGAMDIFFKSKTDASLFKLTWFNK